nr:hypothetical protein [Mycoplasmopsis bovis]
MECHIYDILQQQKVYLLNNVKTILKKFMENYWKKLPPPLFTL